MLQSAEYLVEIDDFPMCAFRRGASARRSQPPVLPGQRGGRVGVGGRLNLHELQAAGHYGCGGHGATSGGE